MFTANLRKSALSCPGNLKHVVTPDMVICGIHKIVISNCFRGFISVLVFRILFEGKLEFSRHKKVLRNTFKAFLLLFLITHRDQMIQITISGRRKLQCAETDVVQSFIVNAESFVGVFDQLVN